MANGTEEIEAVTIIDTLVRGGIKVVSATVHTDGPLEVTCSRGVKLVTDCCITDCVGQNFDMIVCPGGMPGSEHLRDSVPLTEMLKLQGKRGGMIGAICAAPAIVLKTHGLLDNPSRPATGYPADKFKTMIGPGYVAGDSIVVSGSVVTSQGPGTAMPFAVKLIELLVGREKAEAVAKEMLISAPK
jgi:4-methyl-5(b-hydroxyethyl)-thiazole monophosphate biosynthesis